MIDLLLDSGASPTCAMSAITHGNIDAARHLVERGDKLTLPLAVCLDLKDQIQNLVFQSTNDEKITALSAAAYYGKAELIKSLLNLGLDPNGFPSANSGFHAHGTPLHQAVSSGCLSCVKLLVEAGAKLDIQDKIYNGIPLGWATYMRLDTQDEDRRRNFFLVEEYLQSCASNK